MLIPGQEEVGPCSLGLRLSVPCPEEGGSQWPLWGPSPPTPPSRGSQGRGVCDRSLGLERKLLWGGRWIVEEGGWLARGQGVEMDFPLMEGEERTEGGCFLGKPRDESPRDRRAEGGEDMGTSHAGGLQGGGAAAMGHRPCSSSRSRAGHQEDTASGPRKRVTEPG